MKVGDIVKHKEQDIEGKIIEDYGHTVVIIDETLEITDNRLEFRKSDLEEVKKWLRGVQN